MKKCYLLGAGSMGTLAAYYLQQAGVEVLAANRPLLKRRLFWPQGTHSASLSLGADDNQPIAFLVVATKGPDTATALTPLLPRLRAASTIICLQNGMGTLDNIALPQGTTVLYAVTTNAAWREQGQVHIVAENTTLLGGELTQAPPWFAKLTAHWPGLSWCDDIVYEQWRKLTVNAVINPLTAIYRCKNGELLTMPKAFEQMQFIAAQCDRIASRMFPHWPNDTLERAIQVANDTAKNTSSMLADVLAGRTTEFEFINGYLIKH